MKTLLFILVIIITALFYSCQSVNGPINPNVYLPLNIGNYWVYDVNSKDSVNSNFNTHIDSMVVIGTIQDSLGEFYEILYFRDGFIYDTMKMRYNSFGLELNTQVFYPFIPLDTGGCQTSTHCRLLNLTILNDTHIIDTISTELDVLYGQSDSIIVPFSRYLDYNVKKTYDINIYSNSIMYNTTMFSFIGKEYQKFYTDLEIEFPPNFNCEFLEKEKTIVRYSFYLNIYCQDSIGIIQSTGVMNRCNELFSEHTRKLLRYRIN